MIYIRKQTSQEIANITIVQGESIQLFGTQGYTVSQLQSINKLLGMNDCMICIDCHMHSISAHYISVHQKFINKQQPC